MSRLEAILRWLHDPAITRHPRYLAWERRHVIAAVRAGAITLAIVLLADCLVLLSEVPDLFVVNGPGMLLALLIFLSMRRGSPLRRFPVVGGFALGTVAIGTTLVPIELMPAAAAMKIAYLPIVIVGSALFVPWSITSHVPWLILVVTSVVIFVTSPFAGALTPVMQSELVSITVSSSLVSFAGHVILQRERRRAFFHRMQLRGLNQTARRQRREMQALAAQLETVARRDPLTGIGNRLRLDEDVAGLAANDVPERAVAAILLDIDHFKDYNDRHGHLAGDVILREVARTIAINLRPHDRVYRYGGEEFLVLLDASDAAGAIVAAERLREAVAALAIPHLDNRPWGVITVSAGVAAVPAESSQSDDWIREADVRLYAAKAAGRNTVKGEAEAPASTGRPSETAA